MSMVILHGASPDGAVASGPRFHGRTHPATLTDDGSGSGEIPAAASELVILTSSSSTALQVKIFSGF